jgi:hypothetical protein
MYHVMIGANGAFCDLIWYMDKTTICHGEPITLYWDYSQWAGDTLPSRYDWLNIVAPSGTHLWPTNAPHTDSEISTEAISGYAYEWSYMDGTSVGSVTIVNGSLTYRVWEPYSGLFTAAFLTNNLYVAKATFEFVVLPWDHPSCLPSLPNCVMGTPVNDGSCECNAGYFGDLCQYGCGPLTILSGFGNDFSSSIDGSPYYRNAANCSWYISPLLLRSHVYDTSLTSLNTSSSSSNINVDDNDNANDNTPLTITGITIIIEQLGLDTADGLKIYDGALPLVDKKLNTLAGVQTTILKLDYSNVTNSLVQFSSFDTHNGNPNNIGFKASWYAHGCPAGAVVQRLDVVHHYF